MTERLSTLLHDEAHDLAIPTAPTDAVLSTGRRRVRRRRTAFVSVAAVAVLAGGALMHVAGGASRTPVVLDPATAPAATDWAVAQGSTVHLGTGATVTVPGQVKAMYYTSAGTLVRVGSGSTYWLAHPDGTLTDLHLGLGSRVPATDPTLPYLAYTDEGPDADHGTLVIRDVRDGSIVRTIPFSGTFGGWVALSGDHAYVETDGTLLDVHWRAGEVVKTSAPPPTEIRGGHEVVSYDKEGRIEIVDIASNTVLKAFTYDPNVGFKRYPHLSTDGTHVAMLPQTTCESDGTCRNEGKKTRLYNLTTGATSSLPIDFAASGWSATGQLLIVDGSWVDSCDPDTMHCEITKVRLNETGRILVSGNDNES